MFLLNYEKYLLNYEKYSKNAIFICLFALFFDILRRIMKNIHFLPYKTDTIFYLKFNGVAKILSLRHLYISL